MADDVIPDLDHCSRCGNVLPFFTRTVNRQRATPAQCWTCERASATPVIPIGGRPAFRLPTVVHGDLDPRPAA